MAKQSDENLVQNTARASNSKRGITTSSTAEYFSKNLQQVGFSSPTKAVLTTLKEALDNSLDACEDAHILPEIWVEVEKLGSGSLRNTDKIRVVVKDNGPGIETQDVPKVFGEYLASSKFGRGRCSRGQQGIGISAATTWAIQTSATGARVITKQKGQRKATTGVVVMDLKNNKGVFKDKESVDWNMAHGTSVEFTFDGRMQVNGDAGILTYLKGNVLVNPHLTLHFKLPEMKKTETITRVENVCPRVPDPVNPHPHTMKLGDFISHAKLFGKVKLGAWLKKGFSRISDRIILDALKNGNLKKNILDKSLSSITDTEFRQIFTALQKTDLMAPSTNSVLSIGEQGLSKSIQRIGVVDFFSTVSRKPTICDFKPVQVEVAVARLIDKNSDEDQQVQVLRFANRVPLQFDKAACAIVKAISTVSWRNYGLKQARNSLPNGPYIVCVSVVSPFIKFKNASKETIDASEELVEEIRRALMQAGQRLSRHIKKEAKENELEEKIRHLEKFGPILVETLVRITHSNKDRKEKAEIGLMKILGRDAKATKEELEVAETKLSEHNAKRKKRLGLDEDESIELDVEDDSAGEATLINGTRKKAGKKNGKKTKTIRPPGTKAKPKIIRQLPTPKTKKTGKSTKVKKTKTKKK